MLTWEILEKRILECKDCQLHLSCTNKVIGQGNKNAKLMLIGEAPGKQEDEQGLAFVGSAGQLLTKMLNAINISRNEIYICNIVKCRPPNNRIPEPEETRKCMDYLRAQAYLVKPNIILLLGSSAMKAILGEEHRVSKEHGIWYMRGETLIMATYHPAALLYRPENKKDAWEDLKILKKKLEEIKEIENT